MRLELGASVRIDDREFGEVADLVIDPATKRVTHVVVRPRKPADLTRLVPVNLVEPAKEGDLSLRCSVEATHKFEAVQDFAYLGLGERLVDDPDWDVGIEESATPYTPNADIGGYVGSDQMV